MKPAAKRQNIPLSQPPMADNLDLLRQKYQSLSDTLKNVLDEGIKNEAIQSKFFSLELHCLQSTSYNTLVNRLLNELPQHLNLDQVELYLVDDHDDIQQLVKEIYGGLTFANLHYDLSVANLKQLTQNNPQVQLVQENQQLSKLFRNQRKKLIQSAAILPLIRDQKLIGCLNLGSMNKQRFSPNLGTHFLQHLASILAICVENAVTQERFKHMSLVDLLTGSKNRRYFIQAMTREIARSSRSAEPISCLFVDLDHFKQINDSRGHLVGDKALIEVSENIAPMLRSSDVLARFGGEEFTIMLPETDEQAAMEIAERIRLKIAQLHLKDDKGKYFGVTVSIGVSTWQPDLNNFATPESIQNMLINKADMGVYQAKSDGRNCVRKAS